MKGGRRPRAGARRRRGRGHKSPFVHVVGYASWNRRLHSPADRSDDNRISLPPEIMKKFAWICILSHLSLSAKAEVAAKSVAVAAAETGGDGGNDRALDGDIDRPCSLICLNGGSYQLSTDAEVAQLGHPSQYCTCPTGYGGITWYVVACEGSCCFCTCPHNISPVLPHQISSIL